MLARVGSETNRRTKDSCRMVFEFGYPRFIAYCYLTHFPLSRIVTKDSPQIVIAEAST